MPTELCSTLADLVVDRLLDLAAELDGVGFLALAAHQVAGHFVDGEHGTDRGARFDRGDDAMVDFNVGRRPRLARRRCPWHSFFACHTGVPVLMPKRLASMLAAMQQVVSAITGSTPTGLPAQLRAAAAAQPRRRRN